MAMKIMFSSYVIACMVFFYGCGPAMTMKRNNKKILELNLGLSKSDVISIMGPPKYSESYADLDGIQVDILFYHTKGPAIYFAEYHVTKEMTTPVVIYNGKVVGWGDEFYEHRKRLDIHHYTE